jgi:predicted nucleotidyltransferase
MTVKVFDAARVICSQRYPDAAAAFAAGSLMRGEGTPYSDLDLVVVYSALPAAYRESFRFQGLPVEVFVHDPETLEYCFVEMDVASGIPALPHMVMEGQEVPRATDLSRRLKARAAALIDAGPPPLDVEGERRRRYMLSALLDDLRGWQSTEELMACGARLFEELADYCLRARGCCPYFFSRSRNTYSDWPELGCAISGAITIGTFRGLPPPRPVVTAMY